jgi:hypothetical protein
VSRNRGLSGKTLLLLLELDVSFDALVTLEGHHPRARGFLAFWRLVRRLHTIGTLLAVLDQSCGRLDTECNLGISWQGTEFDLCIASHRLKR